MIDLDACFGSNNEWNAGFHRYVDDMIVIVPNPEHVGEVLEVIKAELGDLKLEINEGKTEIYDDVARFLDDTADDDTLNKLSERFAQVVNALWITTSDWRDSLRKSHFETNQEWWYRIRLYHLCLQGVGIFVTPPILSRRVYKYLFNQRKCEDDLKRENELSLPPLPTNDTSKNINEWVACFEERNSNWVADRKKLQAELSDFFCESWQKLSQAVQLEDSSAERKWARRLRFAVNRLSQLGLFFVVDEIVQILCRTPWLIRNPAFIVESLARQGFSEHLFALLIHYSNESDPMQEYMKAIILRAIRFLPNIEPEFWNVIVECTVSPSTVICLLASETWLHLSHRCQHLVEARHLDMVENALIHATQLAPRLEKNYLLILSLYDIDSIKDVSIDEDNFLICAARDIILEGRTKALFDYEEPEILRRTFYSGRRVDDPEDYNPSPL